MRFKLVFASFLLLLIALPAPGQQRRRQGPTTTKWDAMEVGPFFTSGLEDRPRVFKNLSIKVGRHQEASVAFDTQTLRLAAGWTGGFLKLPVGRDGLEGFPQMSGSTVFVAPAGPGWARAGELKDPRKTPFENLPKDWAHYKGLYLHGTQVILAYRVGAAQVLESPGFQPWGGFGFFTRDLEVSQAREDLALAVCEVEGASGAPEGSRLVLRKPNGPVTVLQYRGEAPAQWKVEGGKAWLELPKGPRRRAFQIALWSGPAAQEQLATLAIQQVESVEDLRSLCKGGPSRWNVPVETAGVLGKEEGPYVVDTLTLPEDNPWKSWIRASGFDFFKDGRAAVCSVSGDVWIVSGIDNQLKKLTWKRFATGLFQPLGLKIVQDKVYVLGRDQITRLHDLNKDGEADFYENFNNDVTITQQYHEFCLNLETDSEGNFYFTKGGNLGQAEIPHHGCLLKVSRDGSRLEVVATGLRAPNGLGMGPRNEITTSDNEGNWVPASRVNWTVPGGFYGHVFTAHRPQPPTDYDRPLFWLPHSVDNSSGGQVWVTSKKWGPFHGDMLHLSYGMSSLFKAFVQHVDGTPQGGVVRFPLRFESGVMRGRFSPHDGQLYLCGLVVWQSNGPRQGAFHRVRYTGKPVHMAKDLQVRPGGVEITFTSPLDRESASDADNFAVEQWNYRWAEAYGSKEYSVANPEKIGRDRVEVQSVKLSPDGKSVFLSIANLQPVMQMRIRYNLKAADGTPISENLFNTINAIPGGEPQKVTRN